MRANTSRRMIGFAVLVSIFLAAVDNTIISTATPTIVSDIGGIQQINWVFAIYTLRTGVTTPIYGKLSDLFGRKKVFQPMDG